MDKQRQALEAARQCIEYDLMGRGMSRRVMSQEKVIRLIDEALSSPAGTEERLTCAECGATRTGVACPECGGVMRIINAPKTGGIPAPTFSGAAPETGGEKA